MRGQYRSHGRFCGSGAGSSRKAHANASHTRALTRCGGEGRCYCYYLFVVLTHHLWHFQSIPATPDPVAVRRAVKLKFEMQM